MLHPTPSPSDSQARSKCGAVWLMHVRQETHQGLGIFCGVNSRLFERGKMDRMVRAKWCSV